MKTFRQLLPALFLVLIAGCSKPASETTSPSDEAAAQTADYKTLDAELEADIKESSAEARAWLAMKNNVIFEGSKAEVIALTEAFYKAGCPKVYTTGIEKLGQTFLSASIVVVLPTDGAQRTAAFRIEKEFVAKEGEDGTPDQGQKYLMLTFD